MLPDTDEPHFRQKVKALSKSPEIQAEGGATGPNDYINWLKHGRCKKDGPRIEAVAIPAEESIAVIWRAITKYNVTYDDFSPQMLSFAKWAKDWLQILMLETRFPRIPGDMGNAETWPFPVLYNVVKGASPQRVVMERANGLRDAFLAAARELVDLGADGITTNCGFLSLFQEDIACHVGVPVATSSLMQAPMIERLLPVGRRVGILTVSARTLTREHLLAAGVAPDTPVAGTEDGRELTRVILGNEARLDVAAAERDVLEAGEALIARHPHIGAVLLECTNMAPYARAERAFAITGLRHRELRCLVPRWPKAARFWSPNGEDDQQ